VQNLGLWLKFPENLGQLVQISLVYSNGFHLSFLLVSDDINPMLKLHVTKFQFYPCHSTDSADCSRGNQEN